jgi:hypothetical protein
MNRDISPEVISTIAALGFDVYQCASPDWRSYLYFTDGTRIGYMQTDLGGLRLTTVHVPCKECGTGFGVDFSGALTREELSRAFMVAPAWASPVDRAAVRKWPSMAAFIDSPSNRYAKLELVAKGVR